MKSTNSQISSEDENFLISLHASEEAGVHELFAELLKLGVSEDVIWSKLTTFFNDGLILFFYRDGNQEKLVDFTWQESIGLLEQKKVPDSWYTPCLGFTDSGWSRWDVDDWGITTERAQLLTFGNNSKKR